MDDTNATPEVARDAQPDTDEDLRMDDAAAEQVVGGEAANAASLYRGRYALKLEQAGGLLK